MSLLQPFTRTTTPPEEPPRQGDDVPTSAAARAVSTRARLQMVFITRSSSSPQYHAQARVEEQRDAATEGSKHEQRDWRG